MGKLFSASLIAVPMFDTPAMEAGAVVDPSRVVRCVRAPDVGQFAGGPYNNASCAARATTAM